MAELICFLSNDKVILNYLEKLTTEEDWEKIIFIVNSSDNIDLIKGEKINYILIDSKLPISSLVDYFKEKLKENVSGIEVGLNIVCGSGKEHMAILSALLKIGLGIRLVAYTTDGVKEI